MNRPSYQLLKHPVHFIALGFGTGYFPRAPGTLGTFAGVLIYLFMQGLTWYVYLGLVLAMFIFGIWICGYTARELKAHDHPSIVWDEIVGYLVTMAFAPPGWLWVMSGFVLFRIFDIWKPWPICLLDKRLPGGVGIMADDLVAGIFSLTIVQIIAYIL
jgi:phosphatidylglycerophosphatase A